MNDARDLRVIRPLALLRERLTREFAAATRLPIISENCPACFEGPKERYHVKKLLAAEEALNPTLFASLERAMLPLMTQRGAVAVRWAAADCAGAAAAEPLDPVATAAALARIAASEGAGEGGGIGGACDDEDEGGGFGPGAGAGGAGDLRAFVAAEVGAARRSRAAAGATGSIALRAGAAAAGVSAAHVEAGTP